MFVQFGVGVVLRIPTFDWFYVLPDYDQPVIIIRDLMNAIAINSTVQQN